MTIFSSNLLKKDVKPFGKKEKEKVSFPFTLKYPFF
jgi:hypothetical protein